MTLCLCYAYRRSLHDLVPVPNTADAVAANCPGTIFGQHNLPSGFCHLEQLRNNIFNFCGYTEMFQEGYVTLKSAEIKVEIITYRSHDFETDYVLWLKSKKDVYSRHTFVSPIFYFYNHILAMRDNKCYRCTKITIYYLTIIAEGLTEIMGVID